MPPEEENQKDEGKEREDERACSLIVTLFLFLLLLLLRPPPIIMELFYSIGPYRPRAGGREGLGEQGHPASSNSFPKMFIADIMNF